jgi:hypothetical protein
VCFVEQAAVHNNHSAQKQVLVFLMVDKSLIHNMDFDSS